MPSVTRGALVLAVGLALGCGGAGAPPARGVVEHDLSGWSFRRFQQVLDVEVWVPGNPAVAYTASYARLAAEKRGHLEPSDVASAFVTRYRSDDGVLRALVKFVRRLNQDSNYKVEEQRVGDVRLFVVQGGGELWAMWAAPRHVVKIGGPQLAALPEGVIEAYGERYPSRVTSGALDGPLPPGQDEVPVKPSKEPFDRENPQPDFDKGKR